MVTFTRPMPDASRKPASPLIDFRRLAERLKQVSDLTRLCVVLMLGDGEQSVGGLRSRILCSMTVLSRHLAVLRLAGLIIRRRDGQRNVYTLTDAGRTMRRVVLAVVG